MKEKSDEDGVFATNNEFSEEMMSIRKDFVSIHGEMVLLKNYSSLNFAGIELLSVTFHLALLIFVTIDNYVFPAS